MQTIYETVISIEKLKGRKNCEIRYAKYKGNYEEIAKEADRKSIILTSMTMRDFYRERKAGCER